MCASTKTASAKSNLMLMRNAKREDTMTDSENKAAILDDDDDRILDMEDPLDEFLKKPIPPASPTP